MGGKIQGRGIIFVKKKKFPYGKLITTTGFIDKGCVFR